MPVTQCAKHREMGSADLRKTRDAPDKSFRMIPTLKLPLSFDIRPVRAEVETFTNDDWTPHFNTQYYEGDWSGIALRSGEDAHVALYPDPTAAKFVDTDAMTQVPVGEGNSEDVRV
jgi:hypothetical protein